MTVTPKPATDPKRKQRSKKARAILAGGLVAGIGIVGTLATWNSGVLGETRVTGTDMDPLGGHLEFFDAGGNWVSGDNNGTAHLLADVELPAHTTENINRQVLQKEIGKIRLTWPGAPDDKVALTGHVSIKSDTPRAKGMLGNVYIAPQCNAAPTYGYSFSGPTTTVLALLTQASSKTHVVSGSLDMSVCLHAQLNYTDVEYFGDEDSAQISLDLTAKPVS